MPAEPKVCANPACGQVFTPARRDARYCNSSCRAQASRLRSGSEGPPRPVTVPGGVLLTFEGQFGVRGARTPWPGRLTVLLPDGREKRSLVRIVPSPVRA